MAHVLRVINPGVLATVQDLGRLRHQHWGVPVGGAMDPFAMQAANRLAGNAPGAAAIEITAGGAIFEVVRPTLLALAGGDFGATLDDAALPLWTAIWARAGTVVAFGQRTADWGARTYLAVAGGIDVPMVLDAHSTCLPGAFGGLEGRPLRVGDMLPAAVTHTTALDAGHSWPVTARPVYAAAPVLRMLPGPHLDHFLPDALDQLQAQPFVIGPSSNRIGYRLDGARLPVHVPDLPSLPVFAGVVQVPPDGAPILLLADAQPTGGYPVLAVVIAADLPLAAQLLPGDHARFRQVSNTHAQAAWQEQCGWLASDQPLDDGILPLRLAGA